ncbi:aminoglycoside phosphotransferase [Candidatus Woesearchaeota archaeon B3_Woes]|nr:MAG: aminoglycoside phosphotransferase [Candidatus Woesearchaeota archaeon B3_Woes]
MVKDPKLYESNGKLIYRSDFVRALKKLGIKKGDVVFVHSSLGVFGKPPSFERSWILENLIDVLKESVGKEGTLIVPTFSYSFCKGEVYDKDKTLSTIGILPEFFRNLPDVVRTNHPIFSVGIWGKNKDYYLDISKDSFGKNSIFGKLHKNNAKLILFGAPFESSTFNYYVEQSYGIPYRYMKTFKGKIRKKGIEYEDKCTYFVKYLNKNVVADKKRFENHLRKKGLINDVKVGNGNILMVELKKWYEEGFKVLNKDIFFFLKEKPNLKNIKIIK